MSEISFHSPQWIVQASSRSWSGSRDICMNPVKGHPAVFHTLSRIIEHFPQSRIVIAAPEFDATGNLPAIAALFPAHVETVFGHTESPLKRMIAAHNMFFEGEFFIRIDALNMFFQPLHIQEMWELGVGQQLDCAKFIDDYPIQFTADFYRATSLAQLAKNLPHDSPFQVHPKYALMRDTAYSSAYYMPAEVISDDVLVAARHDSHNIYIEPRDTIGGQRIPHGDTLMFHYTMALPFIKYGDKVLDIACGGVFGPNLLQTKAHHVVGADIDADCIASAIADTGDNPRLTFRCEDVTATSFPDSSFDVVTSFETIEHVDDRRYLLEMHRIIKTVGAC